MRALVALSLVKQLPSLPHIIKYQRVNFSITTDLDTESFVPMGNCCLKGSRSSRMVWAETDDENDQWVYFSDPNLQYQQNLLGDEKTENRQNPSVSVNEDSNNGKNREVKIMLSKKKLEELLGTVDDLRNIPVDQILDRLIDSTDGNQSDDLHHHEQPWRPNLQSIPEEY
ncbi:hypothetical protein LXL04_010058 [Taraxacum kok-saghyz]